MTSWRPATVGCRKEASNRTSQSCFDAEGKPREVFGHAAKAIQKPDALGNISETDYFGADGRPAPGAEGCEVYRVVVGPGGHDATRRCEQASGELTVSLFGWARYEATLDPRGRYLGEAFYGADDLPLSPAGVGWARYTNTLNDYGNYDEIRYFGPDGQPSRDYPAIERYRWDGVRQLEIARFDVDGKPANGPGGWARQATAYDGSGRKLRDTYTDAAGNPVTVTP